MGKYIHKFNTDTDLQTWKISSGYVEPNISYVAEEEKIKFTDDDIDVSGLGLLKQWMTGLDAICVHPVAIPHNEEVYNVVVNAISLHTVNTTANTLQNILFPMSYGGAKKIGFKNLSIRFTRRNPITRPTGLTSDMIGYGGVNGRVMLCLDMPVISGNTNNGIVTGSSLSNPFVCLGELIGNNQFMFRKMFFNQNAYVDGRTFLIDAETLKPIENGTTFIVEETSKQIIKAVYNIENKGDYKRQLSVTQRVEEKTTPEVSDSTYNIVL